MKKTAVIIGAGPAGLTAAYELATRSDIRPIVIEKSDYVGGISRTVNYKGNRIDIGGHRFFSKSDRVMNWWLAQMPLEDTGNDAERIQYQGKSRVVEARDRERATGTETDRIMLIRQRKSRVYYLRKFFSYPITLSPETLGNLGLLRSIKIGFSYLRSTLFPIKDEKSLEQFFINRFGRELYLTFFKSYTEKVWGVPCQEISAEWGAQRIKGLSIGKAVGHFFKKLFAKKSSGNLAQKDTETSLIEQFMYPKLGPGQMWETVADKVRALGGEIYMESDVVQLKTSADGKRLTGVEVRDKDGSTRVIEGDYVFSTMPVKELVRAMDAPVPDRVREVSEGLIYRDFITVGLLLDSMKIYEETPQGRQLVRDNWIYIQEPDVQLGRLQIFNNWSPALVADPGKVWLGLEYFCYETDPIWQLPEEEMVKLATKELSQIGIIDAGAVQDATVIHVPKTYPAYFGAYERFGEIRSYLERFDNLFLVGRNGMHKYNNQDHSMLTAMVAVDNILAGVTDKANIWAVNTEQEYHESKDKELPARPEARTATPVHGGAAPARP